MFFCGFAAVPSQESGIRPVGTLQRAVSYMVDTEDTFAERLAAVRLRQRAKHQMRMPPSRYSATTVRMRLVLTDILWLLQLTDGSRPVRDA